MVAVDASGYAMYVHNSSSSLRFPYLNLSHTRFSVGFDETVPECGGVYLSDTDVRGGTCFQHAWETPEAREYRVSFLS